MTSRSGQVVGDRFELGQRIAGGRSGDVYRAADRKDGDRCVVKFVGDGVFASPLDRQRTQRELTQLATLDSRGVAKVLAVGTDGDTMWIASQFAEGRSLEELVVTLGPLPAARAAALVVVIGKALGDAATVGVMHRDLSAKNVIVADDGSVKLINFGIAVPNGTSVPGVPEFVSPEQVAGRPVDLRANIYSIGTVLYYLICGKTPFQGAPAEVHKHHTETAVTAPSETGVQVPPAIEQVILKSLEKSSAKRYMTLPQFLGELERAVKSAESAELRTTQPMNPTASAPAPQSAVSMLAAAAANAPAGGKAKVPDHKQTLIGMAAISAADAEQYAAAQGKSKADESDDRPTEPMPAMAQPQPVPAPSSSSLGEPAQASVSGEIGASRLANDATAPAAVLGGGLPAPSTGAPVAGAPVPIAHAATAPTTPTPSAAHKTMLGAVAPVIAEPVTTSPPAPQPAPVAEPPQPAVSAGAPAPAPQPATSRPGTEGGAGKGKRKPRRKPRQDKKGKFRETLWFKKGELDAVAAKAAAEAQALNPDELHSDKVDSLPIEDRYGDDGSITASDQQRHSLRTGSTEMHPVVGGGYSDAAIGDISDEELINEMRGGRGPILVAIGVGLVAAIALIIYFAS